MKPYRGALIVFEGLDRSGKTTQCSLLSQRLNSELGLKTVSLKYPNRETPIGKLINDYLFKKVSFDDRSIHLMFSANRWEQNGIVKQYLDDGITCIVDRYAYSGVAYSAIKTDIDKEWCMAPDKGLLRPDRVYYLKTEPAILSERTDFGGEIYEMLNIQRSAQSIFEQFLSNDPIWRSVEANAPINDVHKFIFNDIKEFLQSLKSDPLNFPLKYLW